MGKVTSLYGKTTGKIGSIVFSTSGGETIAREYNPHVANPNTQAQVNQRARLKLMSQLSAALAPVIAIPKQGLVSSRNAFTKLNFDASMAENGVAQISYENVQLTNGNLGLPSIEATRALASGITINLSEDASQSVSRVVYILYRKTAEQRLQFVSSVIAESAGGMGTFPASLPYTEGDIILYAYGMRDTSESASAKYGDLQVQNALDVARLTAYRSISSEDYQFTMTRGATMYADQSEITPVPEGYARVFVTPTSGGTANGAGMFEIGTQVTVVASPNQDFEFVGWRLNGSQTIISTDLQYTFTLNNLTDLVAVFQPSQGALTYIVTVRINADGQTAGATVSGGGEVVAGNSTTVVTTEPTEEGYIFNGWYIGSTRVSGELSYTFIPSENTVITAGWRQEGL